MPNDAKFGLAVGIGLVILVAVVFFHKEPSASVPPAAAVSAQEAPPANAVSPAPARHGTRPPP